jgi:hypothetical protein
MAEATALRLTGSHIVAVGADGRVRSPRIGALNPGQTGGVTTCRISSDVACWFAIGEDPTAAVAAAGSHYLPAAAIEYIDVPFGHRIAVIAVGTTGTMSVSLGAD